MNREDLELKLLAGVPIDIENCGVFYAPTLREIITLGKSKYEQLVSALLFDKNNIELNTDEEVDNFKVFVSYYYHVEDYRNIVNEAVQFFFKEEVQLGSDDNDVFFYFDDEGKRRIDELNFEYIQGLIRKVNFIKNTSEEEDYNPGNEKAKEFIEKLKQWKRNRPKTKENINLHSMISGLTMKSNDLNYFNVFDLTIYQLYNGFFYTENIDNYHHTLSGLYAGTIDGKNIKLPEIHWAKILKN